MAGPTAVPGVDPSGVSTPAELAACLDGLRRRRDLSYEAMEKTAAELASRSGRSRLEPLPKSTVGEIVTGKRLPARVNSFFIPRSNVRIAEGAPPRSR